jgi:hypothetical protein
MVEVRGVLVLVALVAACSGCDQREQRAFFGSIKLGAPEWTNGVCMLPVELPTRIVHSAKWVSEVQSRVDGSNIFVTARVTAPPYTDKKAYGGRVNLGKIKPGNYLVQYRDADGSVHGIGAVSVAAE